MLNGCSQQQRHQLCNGCSVVVLHRACPFLFVTGSNAIRETSKIMHQDPTTKWHVMLVWYIQTYVCIIVVRNMRWFVNIFYEPKQSDERRKETTIKCCDILAHSLRCLWCAVIIMIVINNHTAFWPFCGRRWWWEDIAGETEKCLIGCDDEVLSVRYSDRYVQIQIHLIRKL